MRTFISIEPSKDAKKSFLAIENLLRNSNLSLKLVKIENLHLTLKFLGEISETKLKEIVETCQIIGQTFSPFSLSFKGVGTFPNIKKARIIWVGVEEGREGLKKISKALDEELRKRGFPSKGREFQCHLTLARVKKPAKEKKVLEGLIEKFQEHQFCSFPVNRLCIMKSELKKDGPIYSVLREIRLKKRDSSPYVSE